MLSIADPGEVTLSGLMVRPHCRLAHRAIPSLKAGRPRTKV